MLAVKGEIPRRQSIKLSNAISRFPVHWSGDSESTFEGMGETLRAGLSLTLSGFAFSSHDIGGFEVW